jgi:hypothetical protein
VDSWVYIHVLYVSGVLLFLGSGYFNIMGSLVRLEVGP